VDTSKIDALKIELEQLNEKRDKLLDKYLEDAIAETVYKKKDAELESQIQQLELSIQAEEQKQCEYQTIDERMQILQEEIEHILNDELALHFIYEHILSIRVFEKELYG
jgi:predicted  nucleic acid-binding Zn-ribbon protein